MVRVSLFLTAAVAATCWAQGLPDGAPPPVIRTVDGHIEVTPNQGRVWHRVTLPDGARVTVTATADDESSALAGTDRGFLIHASKDETTTTFLGDCTVTAIEQADGQWGAACGGQPFVSDDNGKSWKEGAREAAAVAVNCASISVIDYNSYPLSAELNDTSFRVRYPAATCRPSAGTPTKSFLSITGFTASGIANTWDIHYRAARNQDLHWRMGNLMLVGVSYQHQVIQRSSQPAGACQFGVPALSIVRAGAAPSVVFTGTVNTMLTPEILSGGGWLSISTPQGNVEMTGWPFVFRALANNTGRARSALVRMNGVRIEGTGAGDCHVNMTVYQN